jgi:hypothetical protein
MDSQSAKSADRVGTEVGFDGGKRVKGRNRHSWSIRWGCSLIPIRCLSGKNHKDTQTTKGKERCKVLQIRCRIGMIPNPVDCLRYPLTPVVLFPHIVTRCFLTS